MIRRNLLHEELGDRHFFELKDNPHFDTRAQFNLEYQVVIDNIGDYKVKREGGILEATNETFHFEIGGTVLIKPYDESTLTPALDNYRVRIEYKLGETYGAGLKPFDEVLAEFTLTEEDLKPFCDSYFPYMGMIGQMVIATKDPLPGDTLRKVFVDLFMDALENSSEIKRTAMAHNAFIGSYMPIKEEGDSDEDRVYKNMTINDFCRIIKSNFCSNNFVNEAKAEITDGKHPLSWVYRSDPGFNSEQSERRGVIIPSRG